MRKFNVSAHIWLILIMARWVYLLQIPVAMSATEKEAQAQANPVNELDALDASYCSITQHNLKAGAVKFNYTATAASITVHDKQSKPIGQIFYIAYKAEQQDQDPRPLTFVFNGGPGAASAYLHLGALGPQRVVFNTDGTVPSMPARIVDNPRSWLAFTDLVFVDPVGTGYSRVIKRDNSSKKNNEKSQKPASSGNTLLKFRLGG